MSLFHSRQIKIEDLRQRKPESVQYLVQTCTEPLLRGAMAMGFNETDAEELVQDTFVSFFEGMDRFRGESAIKTYLFGILRNKGLELLRSQKRESGVEDIESVFDARFDGEAHWLAGMPQGPEDAALSKEIAHFITLCSESLSPDQRMAFFLKEIDGTGQDEICNILSVTYTNLRVLLFRARLQLRECLERNWKNK